VPASYVIEKEGRCEPLFLVRWFSKAAQDRCAWAPIHVPDDGKRTILEMPRSMRADELPELLVIRNGTDHEVAPPPED
jgi:type IV secretory pathway VirB9-like protein